MPSGPKCLLESNADIPTFNRSPKSTKFAPIVTIDSDISE